NQPQSDNPQNRLAQNDARDEHRVHFPTDLKYEFRQDTEVHSAKTYNPIVRRREFQFLSYCEVNSYRFRFKSFEFKVFLEVIILFDLKKHFKLPTSIFQEFLSTFYFIPYTIITFAQI